MINGKVYNKISAPQISHSLATEPLSIGNCNAASLKFTVLTEEEIPEAAAVTVMARLMDLEMTEGTETEALQFGEYWVDTCTKSGNYYTLSCYDAMLKTSQAMVDDSDDEADWPKSMAVVVQEIAYRIGVPIDPRTKIKRGLDYLVPYPKGYTMQQVLGWIGACHGGNWIITEDGMLRLVPLTAPPEDTCHIIDENYNDIVTAEGYALAWQLSAGGPTQAAETGSSVDSITAKTYNIVDHEYNPIVTADGFYLVYNEAGTIEAEQGLIHVPFVGGDITTGKRLKVSRVTMIDGSGNEFTAGDDTGFEVTSDGNPYACQAICDDLYEMLCGIEYEPFTAPSAVFDPATELGDQVKIGSEVHSTIYSMVMSLDIGYSNTISAPTNTELTRQFPFLTGEDKRFAKEYLEASTDYGGVSVTATDGIVVTKTVNTAAAATAAALDLDDAEQAPSAQAEEGRSSGISRAEVQLSDSYISMRARSPETGQMADCIYYDDEAECYRITKAVLIEQANDLEEELQNLADELTSIEGGSGAEAVSLPQLLQAIQAAQSALTEQRLILDGLEDSAAGIETALQAVQTSLTEIADTAASIKAAAEGNAAALGSLGEKITALQAAATAQDTAIAGNKTVLDAIAADTAAVITTLGEHTTALAGADEKLTALQAGQTAQDAVLLGHSNALAAIDEKLSAVQTVLAAQDAVMAGNKTTLDAVAEDTAAIKVTLGDHTAALASVDEKLDTQGNTLELLRTDVAAVQATLSAQGVAIAETKASLDSHTLVLDEILALLKTLAGGDDPSNGGDDTGDGDTGSDDSGDTGNGDSGEDGTGGSSESSNDSGDTDAEETGGEGSGDESEEPAPANPGDEGGSTDGSTDDNETGSDVSTEETTEQEVDNG